MMRSLARLLGDEFSGFVLENEPLSRHTTIRIGGPAALFIAASDVRDKERVIKQILADHPGEVSYINVRVVKSPTWRTA